MAETEVLFRWIGCSDCQQEWKGYCPLCKQRGKTWRDIDGKLARMKSLDDYQRKLVFEATGSTVKIPKRFKKQPPIRQKTTKKTVVKTINGKPRPIEQPTPITIDNFFYATYGEFDEIEEIPNGFVSFFKSKGSEYFTDLKGELLVRVSDHWGSDIKQCCWYLKGCPKNYVGNWKKIVDEPMKIGIIKVSDLNPRI